MSDPIAVLTQRLSAIVVDCEDGFRELRESLPRHAERRPSRWRRRRTAILGGVVAFCVGVGGVAVATGGAHTGLFGLPGFTENDTSEYLNTNAPDFREIALGYADGVDFAPGYSAEMYLGLLNPARQEAQLPPGSPRGRGFIMQATGVQGDIENWAFCSWAHVSTTDQTALQHMREIANTKAMAATNQKDYNLNLVNEAEQGDPGPLQQYLRMNCPQPTPWPTPWPAS